MRAALRIASRVIGHQRPAFVLAALDGLFQLFLLRSGRLQPAKPHQQQRGHSDPTTTSGHSNRHPPAVGQGHELVQAAENGASSPAVIRLLATASVLWTTWNTMPGRMLPVCTAR